MLYTYKQHIKQYVEGSSRFILDDLLGVCLGVFSDSEEIGELRLEFPGDKDGSGKVVTFVSSLKAIFEDLISEIECWCLENSSKK